MKIMATIPSTSVNAAKCKGCDRNIVFVTNENGRQEPFDAKPTRVLTPEPRTDGVLKYTILGDVHLPHFVTCPKAGSFKR